MGDLLEDGRGPADAAVGGQFLIEGERDRVGRPVSAGGDVGDLQGSAGADPQVGDRVVPVGDDRLYRVEGNVGKPRFPVRPEGPLGDAGVDVESYEGQVGRVGDPCLLRGADGVGLGGGVGIRGGGPVGRGGDKLERRGDQAAGPRCAEATPYDHAVGERVGGRGAGGHDSAGGLFLEIGDKPGPAPDGLAGQAAGVQGGEDGGGRERDPDVLEVDGGEAVVRGPGIVGEEGLDGDRYILIDDLADHGGADLHGVQLVDVLDGHVKLSLRCGSPRSC